MKLVGSSALELCGNVGGFPCFLPYQFFKNELVGQHSWNAQKGDERSVPEEPVHANCQVASPAPPSGSCLECLCLRGSEFVTVFMIIIIMAMLLV